MKKEKKINLLTLISYRFLPAKLGGHLAHVFFHNYISKYLNATVVGSIDNEDKGDLDFDLIPLFDRSKINPYIPFSYFFSLKKIVKEKNIDVIMCSHPYMGITAYFLSLVCKIPMVLYSHNIESERFKSMGKWWVPILFQYEKWVMHSARKIFFVAVEDLIWAEKNYKLDKSKLFVSPFGINMTEKPEKLESNKQNLISTYNLNPENKFLYFAGSYDYQPNIDAVHFILDEILPKLNPKLENFTILIIGKGLEENLIQKIKLSNGKVIYLGFVEDIRWVLDSADLMLNPMLSGGGIKTKAVEALGNNIKVVSTENGAGGLDREACGDMLTISADNDWNSLVENINFALNSKAEISNNFYEFYAWEHVTRRVEEEMGRISLV
jgi:polysaccharide biosynthesis protein PslH